MHKIGSGLQFYVYSKGDKVVKLPTTRLQIAKQILTWIPTLIVRPKRLIRAINDTVDEREKTIETLKKKNIKKELLANPVFKKDYIVQDRVNVLGNYLKGDIKDAFMWNDRYCKFIIECWKYGFSDKTFNPTINNGVNKKGRIVLIDTGELLFRKCDILKKIRTKAWLGGWSYTHDMSNALKEYYRNAMSSNLTENVLEKSWKVKLD